MEASKLGFLKRRYVKRQGFRMKRTEGDVSSYNRQAWDQQVEQQNRWTIPVSEDVIRRARDDDWEVVLTPSRPVPRDWFPSLSGLNLLGLASGGGQQSPIFAAAGANVTVLDNSSRQLEQDQMVAQRDGLTIASELGDMGDLSRFADATFDLVFNPCSLSFVPETLPVFQEVARVLRPGGRFLAGFVNPFRYLFDDSKLEQGVFEVRHSLPYSDLTHLTATERATLQDEGEPWIFSHSLEAIIAGQLQCGLQLRDFFEDRPADDRISKYAPAYFATLAFKSEPTWVRGCRVEASFIAVRPGE